MHAAAALKEEANIVIEVIWHIGKSNTYRLDVLWGQWIKLVQVAFTSELLENQRKDLGFFKLFSLISAGPHKPKKLTA